MSNTGFALSGRGITVTFSNGYAVSVQFGNGNYCENRHGKNGDPSADAEIAIFNPEGQMMNLPGGDSVRGWLSPEGVAHVLAEIGRVPLGDRPYLVNIFDAL